MTLDKYQAHLDMICQVDGCEKKVAKARSEMGICNSCLRKHAKYALALDMDTDKYVKRYRKSVLAGKVPIKAQKAVAETA